jgi:hypothetical protein
MNDFASTVSESVKQLGQSFLVAYYLPASAFVLVHLYVLIPIWTGASPSFLATTTEFALPLIGDVNLASLIGTLLLPLVVGILLVGLNSVLILFFEGKLWWLEWGLLYPLTRFNRKRCERLYGHLVGLQQEYRRVSNLLLHAQSSEEQSRVKQQLAGLAQQIDEEHRTIEQDHLRQTLPHDVRRVAPTAFGNAYAISEEYAYERYGVDGVLFWPRLRELMHDSAASHSERITQQKTTLDLSLNFAFICGLLALEALMTLRFGPSGHTGLLIWLALINVALFVSFYDASVSAVRTLGELIKNSFDYHRRLVLQAFELQTPDGLIEEQAVWVRLAAFVRRGDEFYFPADARERVKNEEANREGERQALCTDTFLRPLRWLLGHKDR